MNDASLAKLKKIIADILGLSEAQVTGEFSYQDTDRWDSLKHMEIMMAIEQNFGVTLMVDEIIAMTSVPNIVGILDQKGAGQ